MERRGGENGLGREHYYLDFSAQLDENIDKVLGGNSSPSPPLLVPSSSVISDAPSDQTVVSVAQSPSSPLNHWQEGKLGSGGEEDAKDWEEVEEKQENCTGTLDSICTEGSSLEEPRYAKVTHKQKRGSSSTPRLARKKEEEPKASARDEFARNSVGVSIGNSPLHPARAQDPPGLRLLEAPRPPSSSRHAGAEGRLLASQQSGQHGHSVGQLNHQGNHRDEEEENGQVVIL